MEDEVELADGSWTNGTLGDADVFIIEEGDSHQLMEKFPDKKFIVVQQPVQASLATKMRGYGTCVSIHHSRVVGLSVVVTL